MIPSLSLAPIMTWMYQLVIFIQLRQVEREDFEEDIELILMCSTTLRLVLQFLNIYILYISLPSKGKQKKKSKTN